MRLERRRAALALGLLALLATPLVATPSPTWLRPLLAWQFPRVRWIETRELAERSDVALLDVRSPSEFAVSHLDGARRVDADTPFPIGEHRLVVVYCSVGWRSAAWISARAPEGADVRNLDGGIFAWANEGRPLVRETTGDHRVAVTVVHPFDSLWGVFVRDEAEAYEAGGSP